jgi:hypothetical protein
MTKIYAFVIALLIVFALAGSAANAASPPPRRAVPSARVIVLRSFKTGAICFRGSLPALRIAILRGTLCH